MSSKEDLEELRTIIQTASDNDSKNRKNRLRNNAEVVEAPIRTDSCSPNDDSVKDLKMWATNGDDFIATERAVESLEPGQFVVRYSDSHGFYFHKQDINLDDLLVLPDSNPEQVLDTIKYFWENESKFREHGFLWKRGILLWGPPGSGKCLRKGTPIIMYDGSVKNVEDVVVGDELMGDDSTPRLVQSLARGKEMMYKVSQMNGDDYVVNESHILSLERTTWKKGRYNPHRRTTETIDIPLTKYLKTTDNFKKEYFGYKVPVEFKEQQLPIDPYFLGIWLGDGTASAVEVTSADEEVIEFLQEYAISVGLRFVDRESTTSGAASTFALSGESFTTGSNPIRTSMKELELLNNKHIPDIYKINSRENRLELLAGLLDSDGYLGANCFEFSNTNKLMVSDVVFLARSLGFKVSVSNKTSVNKKTGFVGESQSVHISGHTDTIPTKIKRKQAGPREQIKDPLHTSIDITQLEVGEYYGFKIDGNHRFLLGDFTVTHNTSTVQQLSKQIVDKGGITIYCDEPGATARGLSLLRRIEPDRPVVVIIEDMDAVITQFGEPDLLAMLDGEHQTDNVVFVATTNYPQDLDDRFINRPSRFDEIIKIGMPSAAARQYYLAAKNPRLLDAGNELDEWVSITEGYSIAHLKELIISVECFDKPLEDASLRLRQMIDATASMYTDSTKRAFGFIKDPGGDCGG